MMMKVQGLFLALAFLLLAASSPSTASVLQDMCKSIASSHKDIGYDYCLRFFQTDRGSAAADKRGLAAIAVRATAAVAQNTTGHIASLKHSAKDKRVAQCLSDCADVYSNALGQTGEAANHISSGNASGLSTAVSTVSAVLTAPSTCEQGFRDLKVSSPMATDDAAFTKAATIALFVVSVASKS